MKKLARGKGISLRDFLGKTATVRSGDGDISGQIIGVGTPQSPREVHDSTDFFRLSQFLVHCEKATDKMVIGTQLEANGADVISVNGTPVRAILADGAESTSEIARQPEGEGVRVKSLTQVRPDSSLPAGS